MTSRTVLAALAAFTMAATAVSAQAPAAPAASATPAAQAAAPAAPPRPASPPGTAATQVGGTWAVPANAAPGAAPRYSAGKWIVVTYNRPIIKGRADIFGKGADYGKAISGQSPMWRAGANQTTRLNTEVPLVVGGKTLAVGEYSVFVELKEGAWTLVLSTQPYQRKYDRNDKASTWGSDNYDATFDVLRAPMKVTSHGMSMDQFTIAFVNMSQRGGSLALMWDKTVAVVDFTVGQ